MWRILCLVPLDWWGGLAVDICFKKHDYIDRVSFTPTLFSFLCSIRNTINGHSVLASHCVSIASACRSIFCKSFTNKYHHIVLPHFSLPLSCIWNGNGACWLLACKMYCRGRRGGGGEGVGSIRRFPPILHKYYSIYKYKSHFKSCLVLSVTDCLSLTIAVIHNNSCFSADNSSADRSCFHANADGRFLLLPRRALIKTSFLTVYCMLSRLFWFPSLFSTKGSN